MNVKEFAATAMAAAVADRVQLGSKPTVIDAPPSQVAEYPTIAVWIERAVESYMMSATVLESADGTPLVGAAATDDTGAILDGTPIMLADGVTVSCLGTLRCFGRIWVGSRHVGKREEVEWRVFEAFNASDVDVGRMLIPMSGCRVGEYTIYFGMAAADITESSWSQEHAFSARLWSWRPFTLDIPLLVPRFDPIAQSLLLEFSQDVAQDVNEPSDVTTLTSLEKYLVAQDGSATLTAL